MITTSRTIVSLALKLETSISAQAAGTADKTSRGATREIIFARCSFFFLAEQREQFVTREEGMLFILPREQNSWKIVGQKARESTRYIHMQALARCEVDPCIKEVLKTQGPLPLNR
jgi:hypothetical protein